MIRCDMDKEDEQTIVRFLRGLRAKILDIVQLQRYWIYANVCLLTINVEKQSIKVVVDLSFLAIFKEGMFKSIKEFNTLQTNY